MRGLGRDGTAPPAARKRATSTMTAGQGRVLFCLRRDGAIIVPSSLAQSVELCQDRENPPAPVLAFSPDHVVNDQENDGTA
jgi:hypothetical protein